MSVIEDTRQVLQDFLAPELRAISARLDALEVRFGLVDKKIDDRYNSLDKKIDDRYNSLDKKIDDRHSALDKRIDDRYGSLDRKIDDVDRRAEKRHDEVMSSMRQLIDLNSIQQRLTKLESKEAAHQ